MTIAADRRRPALSVHSLGRVDFEELLALQRRLVYEVSGDRDRAVLLVCEHAPMISVGREGSRAQIHFDAEELLLRGWPVRWVNRGGGCLFHAPGQLAIYPILALDRLGLGLPGYLNTLRAVVMDVAADCGIRGAAPSPGGVVVGGRLAAHLGVAVRDWVSYFGAALNVDPNLDLFRKVNCGGAVEPMTSLERERRLAINPAMVRERLVERFVERFDLPRVTVFEHHPALPDSSWRARIDCLAPDKTYLAARRLTDPV